MKFREIFRFELAYQLRRPWFWLFALVLIVLDFLMIRDRAVADALFEEFFVNAPFFIANTTVFGALIWLVMAANISGDAASRDVASRMHPICYTLPVGERQYLGARFLAAFVANSILLVAVPVGILLGIYLPGISAETISPFTIAPYLTAYAYIALPNGFVATALQFAFSTATGRAMSAYVGSFALVFMGFFVASLLLFKNALGTLLDPIGIRFIVEDIAHLWTPHEKNWRVLSLDGIILENRALWIAFGILFLAITLLTFRFQHRTTTSLWQRFRRKPQAGVASSDQTIAKDATTPRAGVHIHASGFGMHLTQFVVIAASSFRFVAVSLPGLALLFFIPLVTIPVIADQMESNGVPLVPAAMLVVQELTAPLAAGPGRWVIVPALLILFAGELVWRERETGVSEITDAMPRSDWVLLLGKFAGMTLLLIAFTFAQTGAAIIARILLGYGPETLTDELPVYFKIMFGFQLAEYLLFGFLAMAIHVVVNHKYIGHMFATLTYTFIVLSPLFGVERDLLVFGAGPEWSYSEMRGFASVGPWLWFRLYWLGWAILLAVIAKSLWVRGKETEFLLRFRLARQRLKAQSLVIATSALVVVVAAGGFIFYNINVLNTYRSESEAKERRAGYERRYGRYAFTPQPEVAHASLRIELHPKEGSADIEGAYVLVNRTDSSIDTIHVATAAFVDMHTTLSLPADVLVSDNDHGHRIYRLRQPMRPGDSVELFFTVKIGGQGFSEYGTDLSIAENGTFFTNKKWFPAIGYQSDRELITANDRRDHDLPVRPLIASPDDPEAFRGNGNGIAFETIIGTEIDQVAVAPGALRATWTSDSPGRGKRRYFHYATGAGEVIGSEWSFFSARYVVHESSWLPRDDSTAVSIRIYHHPTHTRHLESMVDAIRASLDYYSENFGPYRYSYLSVVERPGPGVGMHADAAMISHGEGFTFWQPEKEGHNHPFAIVAHEMAHQWTVPYANAEGAPVMSESLAWYYAIKAVENSKGNRALDQLLAFMRQPYPYPPIFRGAPLVRALDPYMSYRKGPFALYTLGEYAGTDNVNQALRRLLEKHQSPEAPLATTLDLYRELSAAIPDSLQYLLSDLFLRNTYWKAIINQAKATPVNGKWELSLDIEARKIVIDSTGIQTAVPMKEWVEIGVYPRPASGGAAKPIYLRKHLIESGRHTLKIIVDHEPHRAAVDPRLLLTWEQRSGDQMTDVTIQ